jgi:hypothetical protein
VELIDFFSKEVNFDDEKTFNLAQNLSKEGLHLGDLSELATDRWADYGFEVMDSLLVMKALLKRTKEGPQGPPLKKLRGKKPVPQKEADTSAFIPFSVIC